MEFKIDFLAGHLVERTLAFTKLMYPIKPIRHLIFIFLVCSLFTAKAQITNAYSRNVGDISYDAIIDQAGISACDSSRIVPFYGYEVRYDGNHVAVNEHCLKLFKEKPEYQNYSGYVMLRFLVNCKNETGMYRAISFDESFREISCPEILKKDLIEIAKALKGWQHAVYEGKDYDSFMTLNFKMDHGNILQILPLL